MSVAIVTGASRGLGEALAAGLARAGWSVVLDGREGGALNGGRPRARRAAPGTHLVAMAGDITDPDHRHDLDARHSSSGARSGGEQRRHPRRSRLPRSPTTRSTNCAGLDVNAWRRRPRPGPSHCSRRPASRVLDITSNAAVEAYVGWGGYGAPRPRSNTSAPCGRGEPDLTVWSVDPGDLRTAMHQAAFPGEDISDRPGRRPWCPPSRADRSDRPSGRYRAAELASAGAVA